MFCVSMIITLAVIGQLFIPLNASTQAQSNTKTVKSTNNPKPAVGPSNVVNGKTAQNLSWGFTAETAITSNGTGSGASAVIFRWRQQDSNQATRSASAGTGGVSTWKDPDFSYVIQNGTYNSATAKSLNKEQFFNDRTDTYWRNVASTAGLDIEPAGGYKVDVDGAREGIDNYYRLVLSVGSGTNDLQFGSSSGAFALSSQYIVAYTNEALNPGDNPTNDAFSYKITSTLDGAATGKDGKPVVANIRVTGFPGGANYTSGCTKTTTPTTCAVKKSDVSTSGMITITATYNNRFENYQIANTSNKNVNFDFHATGDTVATVTVTEGNITGTPTGGGATGADCNKHIGILNLAIGKYIACQLGNFTSWMISGVTGVISGLVSTNPWDTIRTEGNGLVTIWKVVLSIVDFIVIAGLLAAAFSNIFRFLPIKLDAYQVKAALPGIIWGIILANISFFAMQLMVETASIMTQGIAEVVATQIGVPVGTQSGGAYLINQAWDKFYITLTQTPVNWFGNIGEGNWFGTVDNIIDDARSGLLGIIGFLLFFILAVVMFMVLLFLLYIRNFVIVTLFIISPLAFFSLGFPPLKQVWGKWWGFFWKWLLMLPLSFGVLGLAAIILNAHINGANQAALTGGRSQGPFDYLFFAGLGIGLIYFAIRVPFMWGQFYGTNVMEKWRKHAPDAAGKAAKVGWDWGGKGLAKFRSSKGDPFMTNLGRKEYADKIAKLKTKHLQRGGETSGQYEARMRRYLEAGQLREVTKKIKKLPSESVNDYLARVQKQYREDTNNKLVDSYGKSNPVRAIAGAGQVYKAYMEGLEANDARLTKTGKVREALMRQYVPYNYIDEQAEKHKKDYSENEDPADLVEQMAKARKWLMDQGMTAEQAAKVLKKGASSNNLAKLITGDPLLSQHPEPGKLAEQFVATKQLRKAYTVTKGTGGGNARKAYEDSLKDGKVAPYSLPAEADEGDLVAGISGGSNDQNWNRIAELVKQGVSQALRETPLRMGTLDSGMHLGIESATLNVAQMGGSLGLDTKSIDQMLLRQRKLGLNKGGPVLGSAGDYGLDEARFRQAAPALESYGHAVRGIRTVAESFEDFSVGEQSQALAKTFAGKDLQDDQLAAIEKNIEMVRPVVAGRPGTVNHAELEKLHADLAGRLNTLPPQSGMDAEALHVELADRVSHAEQAVTLYKEAKSNNITVDDAAYRRQIENIMLSKIGKTFDVAGPEVHQDASKLLSDPKFQSEINAGVGALITTDPVLNHVGQTVALSQEQVGQLTNSIVSRIGEEVKRQPEGTVTSVKSFVNDPKNTEMLRQWFRETTAKVMQEQPTVTTAQTLSPGGEAGAATENVETTNVEQDVQAAEGEPVIGEALNSQNESPAPDTQNSGEAESVPAPSVDEGAQNVASPTPPSSPSMDSVKPPQANL